MNIRVALGALAAACLISTACSSTDPVGSVVARGLDAGFQAIKDDAELGIRVRSTPALADAAGVPRISTEAAEFARETIAYHERLIELAAERAAGTVSPDTPLPPGPTRNPRVR